MAERITALNMYTSAIEDETLHESFERELERLRSEEPPELGHLIAGEMSYEGELLEREDPCRAHSVATRVHQAGPDEVRRAVAAARSAAAEWAAVPMKERATLLLPAIDAIEARRAELAATVTLEGGKVRVEALGEVEEIASLFRRYIEIALEEDAFFEDRVTSPDGYRSRSFLRPYGVFAVIAPFNFPLALVANMSLGALIAGNTVVAKPSELTARCGAAVGEVFRGLDLPAGVFNLVQGGDATGEALVSEPVDGVAFTGSARVGHMLHAKLNEGPYPRPVIAEMGGKNPGIVMPSADLGAAAQALARSAFGMGGQKCNATSRALVHESVADEVAELVVAAAGEVKVGDPIERDVFYGPQIEARSIDRFTRSVEAAQADGTILTGGDTAGDGGYYVQPTVVTGLPRGHSLARDELFLPFLTLIPVASMDDAIEEANAIELGLTAGIFSQDGADVDAFLDRVQAGGLLVNHAGGMTTGIFPGTSTHGGWKASTLTGRHTFGRFWIQEFMHQQWVMQGVS